MEARGREAMEGRKLNEGRERFDELWLVWKRYGNELTRLKGLREL